MLFEAGDLRVRALRASDVARLQAFFDANPGYFVMLTGEPAQPGDAEEEFHDTPPPEMPHGRVMTLAYDDAAGRMQAMAQVVTDLMAPGVWHIGLYIVDQALHGSGAAARCYTALEGWIRAQGAQWLRLGVVQGNTRAERFWHSMGYTELRQRHGQVYGRLTHTVRVLAKPLAGRGLDEYLALVARDRPSRAKTVAIFPQGLSQIDQRCNAGERRVLHQLKRCLEDDYLVWHDIPIGPKARQPDFVVLSPRWGVLLLEVKDWRRSTLAAATRDAVTLNTPRGPATVAHPLRQARDYALELVDLMQRDPQLTHAEGPFAGRLLFPYGWGVVLASLRQAEVEGSDFASLFPAARTLLRDELEDGVDPAAFQQRLWGMFTVSYPHTLTLPQRDRIRWHLFPEMRLPVQQQGTLDLGDPEPASADLLPVMDLQQEQLARTLGEGHRVIHGAAGSGKTMILIHRAQHLAAAAARADQPILVLCFNRELAGRIEHLLRQRGVDERVQVRTFHAWCQDLVRSYQLGSPRAPRRDPAYWEALAQTVEHAVERGRVPGGQYLALLIDEAHDFQDAWLRIAARMVNPASNSLLVLYDDAQSIYQGQRRRFNFASVGIEARGRTSILRLNYRNTSEVLSLAMHCAQSLLQGAGSEKAGGDEDEALPLVQPASAGRHGALPVLLEARHPNEEAELLAERVAAALAGGRGPSDVALLTRTRAMMAPLERALARRGIPFQSMNSTAYRRFDWALPSVKLVTLHSAKGLEFPLVMVAGLQSLPLGDEPLEDAVRLLYVAMTRATHELVLSAHGPSPLVQRVREALAAVARGRPA